MACSVEDGHSLVIGGPLLELCPVKAAWRLKELLDGLVLGGPRAVHSSSTTMVGGGVGIEPNFGIVCGEMQDEALLPAFSLSMLACTTTSGDEIEAERGVHRRAVARRRADGDGWPTQAGVAGGDF